MSEVDCTAAVASANPPPGIALTLTELAAMAVLVLGSQADAEQWLETPALGLDGRRRAVDLVSTPAGAERVRAHLVRLDHGVNA